MNKQIYLDHAATTPMHPSVISRMMTVMQTVAGNPSSTHAHGRAAAQILREARETIAKILSVPSNDLVFTSGGTEADNLAIKGYALANQDKGRHLITTAIEHHAVLHTMAELEGLGFEVTYLQPEQGTISAQQVAQALRPDTILVSVMWANNETGQLLPIAEIGQVLAQHQAVFHCDAVQVVGKLPIKPLELGIDFLAASAHKFHGPKGVGFLYAKPKAYQALLHGGSQENKHRAGTENLPGIAGMAQALVEATADLARSQQKVLQLRQALLTGLADLPHYLNSPIDGLPHVLNIGLPQHLNEQVLMQLDLQGISVSAGSACTAGNIEPSHVLAALYGAQAPQLREAIRISMSEDNTLDDIAYLLQTLKRIIGE